MFRESLAFPTSRGAPRPAWCRRPEFTELSYDGHMTLA
jgi:hypothetical protein